MCLPKFSNNAMQLKVVGQLKSSPRPYTTYNIFFQLQREYILQRDLNVIPKLSPEEVFDPADTSYEGPPLPAMYQDLVLRADWFRPGKALRKKRQHRATHGKISFTDLSKRIATAWHNCSDDVKLFCVTLSDQGMMKYKRELHMQKKIALVAADKPISHEKVSKTNKVVPTKEPSITFSAMNMPMVPMIYPEITPSSSMIRPEITPSSSATINFSSFFESEPQAVSRSNSNFGLVDMQDDEIFSMWMS